MNGFIENIVKQTAAINWEGPAMFSVVVLAVLAVFRQWRVLLVTLLTIVLGWGAGDLIIYNIETSIRFVSVSLVIYSTGGVVCLILILISFLRMAV